MTPNGPPDDFADFIADVLAQADIDTERSGAAAVYDQIVADFETLGFDVDAEALEFQIVVQSWLANDDWNSDTAVLLMDAMIDGELTQDELAVLYAVQVTDEAIDEAVTDSEPDAEDAVDDTTSYVYDSQDGVNDEAEAHFSAIIEGLLEIVADKERRILMLEYGDEIPWWAKPFAIGLQLIVDEAAERIDGFIENAIAE